MRGSWILLLALSLSDSIAQSLGEVARKEAERRRLLEKQGVEGRVLSSERLQQARNGNITTSSLPTNAPDRARRNVPGGQRLPANTYRPALRKLDQQIHQCEDRLLVLQQRYEAERRSMAKSGRFTSSDSANIVRERHYWQIQETESRLKRLRQERLEIYDSGRKAGFLPGELDGHGIVP